MLRKFLVIGDFNLKGVNWVAGNSNSSLETDFINGFADLGLLQCIDSATHNKGNILDTKSSNYDININFLNDCNFDVDFSVSRIKLMLNNLDINKAQGPYGINGTVLKHCSESLAYPLSKIFKLTYNVGCLPCEWKTSNIIPVHKKDDKCNVQNYCPISLISA